MIELEVRTAAREEMVDVTARLRESEAGSGVADGLCHVYCPHTTCGVTVNEGADPEVARDVLDHLGRLVPRSGPWRHAEGNSDAHLKAVLTGSDLTLPVIGGTLGLGRWQSVFLCEFDGPRSRRIWVTVL